MEKPVTISKLYVRPLKGAAQIECKQLLIINYRLIGDHEWCVIAGGPDHWTFVSQRGSRTPNNPAGSGIAAPKMCMVQPRYSDEGGFMYFSAPGVKEPLKILSCGYKNGANREFEIWGDDCVGIDQGDEAAQWFEQYLNSQMTRGCRLVRISPSHMRFDRYFPGHRIAFPDAAGLLVTDWGSHDKLAETFGRMWSKRMDGPDSIRSTIILRGLEPHEEDTIASFKAGNVEISMTTPCVRCSVPGINQKDGRLDPKVLSTLASYRSIEDPNEPGRKKTIFGMNASPLSNNGTLSVGSEVTILKRREPPVLLST